MEFNISTKNRFALFEDEPEMENAVVEESVKPVKKPAKGQAGKGKSNVKPAAKNVVAPMPVAQKPVAPKPVAQPQPQSPKKQFVERHDSALKPAHQNQQRYEKPDLGKKRPPKQAHFDKHKSAAPVEVTNFADEFPATDSPVGEESKKEGDEPTKEAVEGTDTEAEKPPPVQEIRSYADYKANLKLVEDKFNVRKAGEGADHKIFKKLVPIARNTTLLPDEKEPEPEERVKTNRKARETKVNLPPGELFQLPRRGRNRRDGDNERRPYNNDKVGGGADPSSEHTGGFDGSRPNSRGGGFRGGRGGGGPRRGGDHGRFHGGEGGAERVDRPPPRGDGSSGNFRGGGSGGGNFRGGRGSGNVRGGRGGGAPRPTLESPGGPSSPQQQAPAAAVLVDEVGW